MVEASMASALNKKIKIIMIIIWHDKSAKKQTLGVSEFESDQNHAQKHTRKLWAFWANYITSS